ncbi:MAG TPA: ABC transporter permease subunit [Clostridiaceae bacterium]
MNVFIREMKANRKSLIIWSIGILLMVLSGMGKFTAATSGDANSTSQILSSMPSSVRAILGIGNFDVSKASGYYGIIFFYLVLMATIHAAILGANIISKEERDKTSEFLYAKPMSRSKIITSKLLAALVNLIIFNLVTLLCSLGIMAKLDTVENVTGGILMLMVSLFILQLIYLFIGTALAALRKEPKAATSTATTIVLFGYILSVLIDLNQKLINLKYLTPFKYFDTKNIIYGGSFDVATLILSILIIAFTLYITYSFGNKRDLL